jgi:WD40 repeat protein
MSLTTGQIIGGHYQVIERLGGGGFGETYLSKDLHLPDRPKRVIKRLSPRIQEASVLQISRRLFETEAQVLYRLGTHPQIPQLFAHFEELAEFYLVQEYIDGKDLGHELLRGKIWEQFTIANLLQSLLTVLDFVHQNNVIHRDIKPENIIRRRDGQLFLIDFGVVKEIATSSTIVIDQPISSSNYTVGIGTPGYMPSEQAHGEPKFASDIYAIGMLGIQALTGISPSHLGKDDNLEILWRQQAPKVYPEFADILSQMVKFDFRQRYATASAAYRAIKEFCDRYPISNVNHSLPTVQISNGGNSVNLTNQQSTHLKNPQERSLTSILNESSNPIPVTAKLRDASSKFQEPEPPQSASKQYFQPWHLGLGLVTISAIAITSAYLFVNPNLSPNRQENSSELNLNPSSTSRFDISFVKELFNNPESNDPIYGVAVSPTNKLLAVASSNQSIELWNFESDNSLRILKGHKGRVYDVYFSPDGTKLVSGSDNGEIIIWDVASGKIIHSLIGQQERIYTTIFSPDGQLVVSCSSDRKIRIWDVKSGKQIKTLQEKSWVYDASFDPDGKTLVSGSRSGAIRLWSVETGKPIKTIVEKGTPVRSIVYSNDGKLIASAMEDNTVRLWDGKTGQFVEVLTGHTNEVHTVAFSEDSSLLASGSADKTIRVWDVKTKRLLQVLSDHELGVASVDFSKDGKFLISGSFDGKVKVWRVADNR